ncbi:MAG: hypothetical protein ACOZCL_00500 [Bacillota bacterium]
MNWEGCEMIAEEQGINMYNEGMLHSQLKQWYAKPNDRLESKVDGYIVDIVRDELLIEIQTANFSAISKKLGKLVENHKVRLLYPVYLEKNIIKLSGTQDSVISKKKSPAKGTLADVFNELIRIPHIIRQKNFSMEILFIKIDEYRCDDGKGSWRRKGASIIEKRLREVVATKSLNCPQDYLCMLPNDIDQPFTNKQLASKLNISIKKATKITYCLKKMNVLHTAGKSGRSTLYRKLYLSD